MTTAKRGDLVLIAERRDYGDREPTHTIERVVSVTRDGLPRVTVQHILGHDSEERFFIQRNDRFGQRRIPRVYYKSHLLIPAAEVDVERLWAAWLARYDDWHVPPFESIDKARQFCAPFRRNA